MLPNLVILDATEPRQPSSSAGIRQLTADQVQMLRAFIQKRVKNADDVDDILQCVFLEALRNEHKFQHASKPQTRLCGIALNLIRNHFRKMYRQPYQESWEDEVHTDRVERRYHPSGRRAPTAGTRHRGHRLPADEHAEGSGSFSGNGWQLSGNRQHARCSYRHRPLPTVPGTGAAQATDRPVRLSEHLSGTNLRAKPHTVAIPHHLDGNHAYIQFSQSCPRQHRESTHLWRTGC